MHQWSFLHHVTGIMDTVILQLRALPWLISYLVVHVFTCHWCLDLLNANRYGEDACNVAGTEVTLNYITAEEQIKKNGRKRKYWLWTLTVVFWVTVQLARGLQLLSFCDILVERKKEEIWCEWQDQSQQFCSATLAGPDSLTCVTAVTTCRVCSESLSHVKCLQCGCTCAVYRCWFFTLTQTWQVWNCGDLQHHG